LDAKKAIDLAALKAAGVMRSSAVDVKLLAKGEIKAKLTITVDAISAAAKAAVEKTGGSVTVVEKPAAPAKKADKKAAASA
jgi:large subunit ribosomal protein L15